MKQLRYTFFIILLTVSVLLQNCKKDPQPCGRQKDYHYLSEENKSKVNYTCIRKEKYGDGQSKETYNINYPYTLLNYINGVCMDKQLKNIRDNILAARPDKLGGKNKKEFYTINLDLWNFAWGNETNKNGNPNAEPSQYPIWAKARGFIYCLNIRPDRTKMNHDSLETLGWVVEKTLQVINFYSSKNFVFKYSILKLVLNLNSL